jgi:hypothetical protein
MIFHSFLVVLLSARWSKNWEPNCGKVVIQGGTEFKIVVQRQFGQRKTTTTTTTTTTKPFSPKQVGVG